MSLEPTTRTDYRASGVTRYRAPESEARGLSRLQNHAAKSALAIMQCTPFTESTT
jgi:hypothetical protein